MSNNQQVDGFLRRYAAPIAALLMVGAGTGFSAGCELIAQVDRSQIGGSGGAGTMGSGGAPMTSSSSSSKSTTSASTGGGGAGGSMCMPVDDMNQCTDDVCENGMPVHKPIAVGTPCSMGTGVQCDGAGACVECLVGTDCAGMDSACQTRTCKMGKCGMDFAAAGTPLPVQTVGDCLTAECDGNGGTKPANTDADVPVDNNACTDDVCTSGVPSNPPKPQGTTCGVNLLCNATGQCVGCNVPSDCPGADDECKTRTCGAGGVCGVSYTAAGTPVAAQTAHDCLINACDGSGNISPIADDTDLPVDDNNACTDEVCTAGVPSHPPKANNTACDDGNGCTLGDTCQSGVCAGGAPKVCAAQDQCHVAGTCDPATGVCSNPNAADGAACNDSDACTQSDTCQAGTCTGANPITCSAQDQCHAAGTCNPATGVCSNPTLPDGSACNDGSVCTQTDTCQAGTCTGTNPVTCTAQDQCHAAGSCNPATGCSNPTVPDGTACNDGNACTQTDSCQAGTCAGANPVTCSAQDQCHAAGTCNPATGVCSNPTLPNGAACSDGDACTQADTCQAGACMSGSPVTCSAQDQCHAAGTCNPATGVCSNPSLPDGAACSDGNACTLVDTCQAGTCTGGSPVSCAALDQCHTVGVCNPATGMCSNPNAADGTACILPTGPGSCLGGMCSGCGNGILDGTEQCDDANMINGDGCDNNCTITACGNGIVTAGESCDDGNSTLGDGCDDGPNGNCTASACGNGVMAPGEGCDDGNLANNDGCSSACKVEAPYTCLGIKPSVCKSTAEINCNDGVDNDADGFIDCLDPDCALACDAMNFGTCAAGESLLEYTSTDVPKAIPDNNVAGVNSNIVVGGLGVVTRTVMQMSITHAYDADLDVILRSPAPVPTDVTSDNGGAGDNYTNTIFNSSCATSVTAGVAPFTGCFKPEATFAIYSGAQAKGTWVLNPADDVAADTGTLTSWRLALCVSQTTCGDGTLNAGETCDDGNSVNGDGCDSNCKPTGCGNGVVSAGETCDDGNLVDGDGCDSNCKPTGCGNGIITAGEICDDGNLVNGDGCDSNCKPTGCGNGVVSAGEGCDDGNMMSGDGCSSACAIEAGYFCLGNVNACAPVCGDTMVISPETCDDGNLTNGDGCDSGCTTETPFTEIEPNGTLAQADTNAGAGLLISGPSTMISGAITPTGDKDIFKMSLASAGVVRFETFDPSGNDCTAALVPAAMKLTVVGTKACTVATQAADCAGIGPSATCNATTLTCQVNVDTVTSGIGLCPELNLNMAAGTYYVMVEKSTAGTIAGYKLQVKIQTSRGNETEPNDTNATSNGLAGTDVYIFGGHQVAGDKDFFAIPVPPGRSVRAEIIEGSGAETCESLGIDSKIFLVSPANVDLGSDDDAGRGYCSQIDGTGATPLHAFAHNLAPGFYGVRVEASNLCSGAGCQFDYRLVVTIR